MYKRQELANPPPVTVFRPFLTPFAPVSQAPAERFLRSKLIFDQRLSAYAYTSQQFSELLGSPDMLEFFFLVDGPQGSPAATLIMEHSPDGVHWATHTYWLDAVNFTTKTVYRFSNASFPMSSSLRRINVGVTVGSARARLWVTSRGSGKRRFSELVFDEQMSSGLTLYTDQRLSSLLGSSDKLQLFAVVSDAAGTSPTLTVQIEESPDGITWKNKQGTAEISGSFLNVGAITKIMGQDADTLPTSAFVRLRVQVGGTGGQAHAMIYATGRGQ